MWLLRLLEKLEGRESCVTLRRKLSSADKETSRLQAELEAVRKQYRDERADYEAENARQASTIRLHEEELKLLAAIIARDRERVEAETKIQAIKGEQAGTAHGRH
jgi:hypothetical protein